jgi:hypothetical protein
MIFLAISDCYWNKKPDLAVNDNPTSQDRTVKRHRGFDGWGWRPRLGPNPRSTPPAPRHQRVRLELGLRLRDRFQRANNLD